MGTKKMLTGNYAAAYGARLARIEVMPVYPITPQTPLMEKVVEFIEGGDLDAEFIPVESEHSVMAAGVAAEAMGARTFTATSAQGLVYMHENLFVASATRLPIVMAIVNRFVGPPQTIVPDHTDSLDQRDTGWIQIYVENAQEVCNFDATYVLAEPDSELERMLLEREAAPYTGMKDDGTRIDAIADYAQAIGAVDLIWT